LKLTVVNVPMVLAIPPDAREVEGWVDKTLFHMQRELTPGSALLDYNVGKITEVDVSAADVDSYEEGDAFNEPAGRYLLIVEGDVFPEIYGPFQCDEKRLLAARIWRVLETDEDGVYRVNVRFDGTVEAECFTGGDLDMPCEDVAGEVAACLGVSVKIQPDPELVGSFFYTVDGERYELGRMDEEDAWFAALQYLVNGNDKKTEDFIRKTFAVSDIKRRRQTKNESHGRTD